MTRVYCLKGRLLRAKLSFFPKINPSELGHMELYAGQNVMTSSVLLKSSTQLYSIQLHYIHEIAPHREYRLPIRRFEQEYEFLSTVQHNIVQYLGTHQDLDTGLPVLLMELMDDSLTHFLESSPQPISYHIQINICHDITLALSFLHSNGIVHRDLSLSSNYYMWRQLIILLL